jgi:ubiquitin-like protein ATG12
MTMAASVVLEHLPKDAHQALETAGTLEQEKGTHERATLDCH